jgi:signal transduction histidine kinase
MSRILLLTDHKQNRHLLADCLARHHDVVLPDADQALHEPFDLCILDGPALTRLWGQVQARKEVEAPVFSPVLLLASRQGVDLATRHLWRTIDEVMLGPIEKVELQARVEILLRARRLSLALKQRQEDLEAFIHAMAHDLRAPVRGIAGLARELHADAGTHLGAAGQRYLHRILGLTEQMQELIAALLGFYQLGYTQLRLRRIELQHVVASCLRNLREDIQASGATVSVRGELGVAHADPALLKIALTNLLSNALKFGVPGVPPRVTIAASMAGEVCRIYVEDNGIGIAPEHQQRIFEPFVRLHGVEEYPGIGLGLATVAKSVELMGGRLGVTSAPGKGSTFWIELKRPEVGHEVYDRR